MNSMAHTPRPSSMTNRTQKPELVPAPSPPSMTIAAASNPWFRNWEPSCPSRILGGTSCWSTTCIGSTTTSRSARPDDAARIYARSDRSALDCGSGSNRTRRRISLFQSAGIWSGGCACGRYSGINASFFCPIQVIVFSFRFVSSGRIR